MLKCPLSKTLITYFILFPILLFAKSENPSISNFHFSRDLNSSLQESFFGFFYQDSLINIVLPEGVNAGSLIASFTLENADSALVSGRKQISNTSIQNFNLPKLYYLYKNGVIVKNYWVQVVKTGLPLLVIETEYGQPITSKEDYIEANLQLFHPVSMGGHRSHMETRIRLRGNSTFNFEKKPYRLKLNNSQSLLGMPAHKDWVLLANYADKSLLRNELAFEMSRRFGLTYTPRARFVDVIVNNKYVGTYQLAEQIEVGANRLNIKEMKFNDTSASSISGGYLLEVDERLDGPNWFFSQFNIPFVIKEPEPISESQKTYISNYIKNIERALFFVDPNDTINGYKSLINTQSFIDWYLVNEISKNNDALFFSSVFMHKDLNEKLKIGPVWDFDIAFGNVNYNFNDYPQGWWVRNHLWFAGLFSDTSFKNSLHNKWNESLNEKINTLENFIDSVAGHIYKSQELNYQVWQTLDSLVFSNPAAYGSFQEEVNALKKWLTIRINWIDKQINPEPINNFTLIEPQDLSSVTFTNSGENLLTFQWTAANSSARYYVKFESIDETITDTVVFYSDLWSSGTIFTLQNKHLLELNRVFNRDKKDEFSVKWNVYYFNEITFRSDNENRILHINIPNELQKFNLISPVNNQEHIVGQNANSELNFRWENASPFATYQLYFDSNYNDAIPFNNWIIYPKIFKSNIATIPANELIDLFSNNGYHRIDTLRIKWKVKADYAHYSDWSSSSFILNFIKQASTGITAQVQESRIYIFPNPSKETVYVLLSHLNQKTQLELIDLRGKKIVEANLEIGEDYSFKSSEFEKGIYLLNIKTENGLISKKIVFE